MGKQAGITLDCSLYTEKITEIVASLNRIGWGFSGQQKTFLPLHDDDMFDWQTAEMTDEALFALLDEKQRCGETCGVELYYRQTGRGIHLLAKHTGEIGMHICINRKTLSSGFTDASWYIAHIAAKLDAVGCLVESVRFDEHI